MRAFTGLLAVVLVAATHHAGSVRAEDQQVTWTSVVNATVDSTGTILQKTGGCDGCTDAGASSQQELPEGDGYVEFTVGEPGTIWAAGLSHGDEGVTFGDIDFGIRFNGAGIADVLENGVYQGGDRAYKPGDVFRVAVIDGRVRYFQNGVSIRESAKRPQYPLVLDVSLATMGATLRDGKLQAPASRARGR